MSHPTRVSGLSGHNRSEAGRRQDSDTTAGGTGNGNEGFSKFPISNICFLVQEMDFQGVVTNILYHNG